eukprot:4849311-Alexandrium_andersonii.AAC.1
MRNSLDATWPFHSRTTCMGRPHDAAETTMFDAMLQKRGGSMLQGRCCRRDDDARGDGRGDCDGARTGDAEPGNHM